MSQISEEDKQRISRTKYIIGVTFDKISSDVKDCNLVGIARGAVRITDNGRALRDEDAISFNEYLAIINRVDKIITDAARNCKCEKI